MPHRVQAQMAVLLGHTCESFGPKLFIWLFLSATSVSSVHLCPLLKKKIHPPTQNDMSPWAIHRFPLDHQQNRAKLTQRTPSTLNPLFHLGSPFQTKKMNRHLTQGSNTNKCCKRKQRSYLSVFSCCLFPLVGEISPLQFCIYFCLLLTTQRRAGCHLLT